MCEDIPKSDDADASALSFRSHQDALDFASHGVERANRMLAANNLVNVIERYCEGDIEIALEIKSRRYVAQYELVFGAIPPRYEPFKSLKLPVGAKIETMVANRDNCGLAASDVEWPQELVLGGITQREKLLRVKAAQSHRC